MNLVKMILLGIIQSCAFLCRNQLVASDYAIFVNNVIEKSFQVYHA